MLITPSAQRALVHMQVVTRHSEWLGGQAATQHVICGAQSLVHSSLRSLLMLDECLSRLSRATAVAKQLTRHPHWPQNSSTLVTMRGRRARISGPASLPPGSLASDLTRSASPDDANGTNAYSVNLFTCYKRDAHAHRALERLLPPRRCIADQCSPLCRPQTADHPTCSW